MRIAQLRRREPLDDIVAETLSTGWSHVLGTPVAVSFSRRATGQRWWEQPILSAYVTAEAGPMVRRYLRDSFRFSPVWYRKIPQWCLGEILASPVGLRVSSRRGFRVDRALDGSRDLLVAPGNRRIRVFDFRVGTVRVFLKAGFDPSSMDREIAIRRGSCSGPFPPVLSTNRSPRYFNEPILEGYTLPRCPPWIRQERIRAEAFRRLNEWLHKTEREACLEAYIEERLTSVDRMSARLARTIYPEASRLPQLAGVLAEQARELGALTLAQSHGDFQPGNIVLSRKGNRVWLVDWEHSRPRSVFYDFLVFGLATRAASGLGRRLSGFLRGRHMPPGLPAEAVRRQWRGAALALFLLEDIEWFLSESTSGPFRAPSEGLMLYQRELSRIGPGLRYLLGGR